MVTGLMVTDGAGEIVPEPLRSAAAKASTGLVKPPTHRFPLASKAIAPGKSNVVEVSFRLGITTRGKYGVAGSASCSLVSSNIPSGSPPGIPSPAIQRLPELSNLMSQMYLNTGEVNTA